MLPGPTPTHVRQPWVQTELLIHQGETKSKNNINDNKLGLSWAKICCIKLIKNSDLQAGI